MTPPRRRHWLYLVRTSLICVLLVVIYYLAPVEPDVDAARLLWRAVMAVTGVVVVALLITRLVARLLREESGAVAALVVALVGGLILFAFVDYLVATSAPDQFVGLRTKTDGLYFAVTTLVTVGYGDIHAAGQLARVVVMVQQLFNVAVLTTGASVLVKRIATAIAGGQPFGRPAPRSR